jgi:uncharacterized protein YeaO (DUF488 family)
MAAKAASIQIKRAYEPASRSDGQRFLVERLWPRGVKKEALELDEWMKEVAPSPELRKWFDHREERWEEFRRRYEAELDENPSAWKPILDASAKRKVTLLFSARDLDHNSAVVLRDYLTARAKRRPTGRARSRA